MKSIFCTALFSLILSTSFTAKASFMNKPVAIHLDTAGNSKVWTEEEKILIEKMKNTSKVIPLTYNDKVKYFIDKYTSKNYRPYMSRLLGLSKHYFNVYDKVFKEMKVPNEVKYLSLVESSLDPHLVSRSGAVGPWQFIYTTARIYDMDMNAHIDERKDIYTATYAVSKYLLEAYSMFNDWTLALASYNCGKGCVQRAIARSGINNPSFWELSPFLPQETQNYIPKYIAMTYVLSNASYYGIEPAATELQYDSKIVMVNKVVDLNQIAAAINIELKHLKHYNPAYKKSHIYGSIEKPKRLFLPVTAQVNDSLLYLALNAPSSLQTLPKENETLLAKNETHYRVKKGETLATVARKFGVSSQDIKAWNKLHNNSPIVGRTLIVSAGVSNTLAKSVAKTTAKHTNANSRTAYYIVRKGDSLDRIARKFNGSTVNQIKKDNNLKGSIIKPGMKLKITKD